jgi:F0F1-type ATP synthase assembly protein I
VKNPLRSNFKKKPSDSSEPEDELEKDSKIPEIYGFARYSNIIYLMIGAIAVSFGIGYFLDWIFHLSFPVFKVIFSFGGVILALYLIFQELNRK